MEQAQHHREGMQDLMDKAHEEAREDDQLFETHTEALKHKEAIENAVAKVDELLKAIGTLYTYDAHLGILEELAQPIMAIRDKIVKQKFNFNESSEGKKLDTEK